jgi:putative addiction module CopG family antidote
MATIKVTLKEHQQEVLDNMVKSGRYASVDEAVQAGVDALEETDAFFTDAVRDEIRAMVNAPEAGIPIDEARRRTMQYIDAQQEKAAKRGA